MKSIEMNKTLHAVRFVANRAATYQLVCHTSRFAEPITRILPAGAEVWILSDQQPLFPTGAKSG